MSGFINCIVIVPMFLMMPKGGKVSTQVPEDWGDSFFGGVRVSSMVICAATWWGMWVVLFRVFMVTWLELLGGTWLSCCWSEGECMCAWVNLSCAYILCLCPECFWTVCLYAWMHCVFMHGLRGNLLALLACVNLSWVLSVMSFAYMSLLGSRGNWSESLRGNLRDCFVEIVVSLSSSKRGKLMGPPGVLMCDKLTKYLTCARVFVS